MKIVYVRDCDRNPYGCVVEHEGYYGYSVCHPGETFKKAKAREIASGRLAVRAMTKQEVLNAVPKYVQWAFDEVITDIENYKNTRFSPVAASTCGSHMCCQPEKVVTPYSTATMPKAEASKSEGLVAMVKGLFSR